MFFSRLVYALFMTLCAMTASAAVMPRDVYAPPITDPTNGTVWSVGENRTVTWDVSNPPSQITNPVGFIMLRKGGLTTPLILAANFSILDGKHDVQVPFVLNGSDYQLVLFGDSGDWSANFTILSPVAF